MERQVKRTTEIEMCCNNIKLLTEMLNHYSPSSPSQDKELMKASEILCGHRVQNCSRLPAIAGTLATLAGDFSPEK